ncbi:MAG: hypothetical protein ABIH23_31575, partial [bacterium]
PSLTFRRQMVSGPATVQREIILENVSETVRTISLQVDFQRESLLKSSSVTPTETPIEPGERKNVTLALSFDPPSSHYQAMPIEGDVLMNIEGMEEPLRVPFWLRTVLAPPPEGNVLLVDDDGGQESEVFYYAVLNQLSYNFTKWDVTELRQHPDCEYMSIFKTVVWFTGASSLKSVPDEILEGKRDERYRFNNELTKYLARGGTLLLSGQDWSDWHSHSIFEEENSLFGQRMLHISRFNADRFYTNFSMGMTIFGLPESAVGGDIGTGELTFDGSFENYTDTVTIDTSGMAKPAFGANDDPGKVVGITVETCTYRAMFLAFALERLSQETMSKIVGGSLSWLTNWQPETLSIQSVEPSSQPDTSQPLTVRLAAEGLTFSVGNLISLDDFNMPIVSCDACSQLEIVVPAGLSDGLYDITLRTPDGQSVTSPDAFTVGEGDPQTDIDEWQIHD